MKRKEVIETVKYSAIGFISLGIALLIAIGIAILGFFGLFFYALDDTIAVPFKINSKRIPVIYQKAGFDGKISHLENRSNPHAQRISYSYTEKIGKDKETYHFYFSIGRSKKEPKYSYRDIVDLYTGHYSESYEYDSGLFSEFFDTALYKNKEMDSYRSQLKNALQEVGLKNVKVEINKEIIESANKNNDLLNETLKEDLEMINKNGKKALWGINQLEPFKYLKMGLTSLNISTDTDIKFFSDYTEKIDKTKLKPGYYVISDSSYYSVYLLNEKLEWENITPQD